MWSWERARAAGVAGRHGVRLDGAVRLATALSLVLSAIAIQLPVLGHGNPALARTDRRPSASSLPIVVASSGMLPSRQAAAGPAASGILALDPDAGPPGTSVSVDGSGFVPGSVIDVAYVDPVDSITQVITATASGDGSLPQSTFVVPLDAAPGSLGHVVASIGSAAVASSLFGVTPFIQALDVSANVVQPGGVAQVSGSGFAPNSAVTVSLCDAAGVQIVQTQPVTTTGAGVIPPMSVSIPDTMADGVAAVNIIDTAGNAGAVPITVEATSSGTTISLSPPVAALGETVRLAAAGFTPDEPIQLNVQDASTAVTDLSASANLQADATGALSGTFVLPLDDETFANPPSGRSQNSGGNAGSLLQVVIKGTSSGLTLQSPLVVPGTALAVNPARVASHLASMVSGRGYYAGETIAVSAVGNNGAITQLGFATATPAGAFSLAVTVPATAIGGASGSSFTVSASGEASDLVASATLIVVAPAVLAFTEYVVASGQSTTLQGTGFAGSTPITITLQAPWSSNTAIGTSEAYPLQTTTDPSGSFSVPVAAPVDAPAGSVTFRAVDATGRSAAGVLTITNLPASLRISNIIAGTGSAITVEGSGFAAGETIDVYLAPPSIPVRPLAGSARQVVADSSGSFTVAFPLPAADGDPGTLIATGGYLIWASGELSKRKATHGLALQASATGTPGPTGVATRTPSPGGCSETTANGGQSSASETVAYFANGTTMVAKAAPGLTVSYSQSLHVANVADQAAVVTVMYLIATTSGSPAIRQVSFSVPAHGIVQHTINGDIGSGHTLSIMVRVEIQATCATSTATPTTRSASCAAGATCDTGIRVILLTRRTLQEPLSECKLSKKNDPSAVDCTTSASKSGTVTRMLDDSTTAGSSLWATGRAQGSGAGGPSSTWRFAEGNTGTEYQDAIDMMNPQTVPATVRITFYTQTGAISAREVLHLGAFDTTTFDVRATYLRATGCAATTGSTAETPQKCVAPLAGVAVGVGLESSQPIVAERALSWGPGPQDFKAGYDVSPGVTSASTVAHFAYASTLDGNQAVLALINPAKTCAGATNCLARVSVTTYSDSGLRLGSASLQVPAGGRATLALSSITQGKVCSLSVRSTVPVVAELGQFVGGPASAGQHPGFEVQGSSGNTQLAAIGLQSTDTPTLVRVFNPTGSRMFVRVSAYQSAGAPMASAGYWVGGRASLEMALAEPAIHSGAKPSGTLQALAVVVTCSGVCVPAVLEGVRGAATALPSHAVPEALNSSLS